MGHSISYRRAMAAHAPEITTALYLLLFKDDGRPETMGQQSGYGLVGALLSDLTTAGRLTVSEDGKRLVVLDASPTGDPLLDEGLARLSRYDGKKLDRAIDGASRRLPGAVGELLAERGILTIEERSFLGIRSRRYPPADPSLEQRLRSGLVAVLRGAEPDAVQHTLLGIIKGLDIGPAVFDETETGLTKRELRRRLKELAETAGPESDAVGRTVAAMAAAIMAATVATTTSS